MKVLLFLAHCVRTTVAIAFLLAVHIFGDITGYAINGDKTPGPSNQQIVHVNHNVAPYPLDLGHRRRALSADELCFSRISAQAKSTNPEFNRMIGRLHDVFGHDLIAVTRSPGLIHVNPMPADHPWLAGMKVPSCLTRKEDYPAIIRTVGN
ncbi:hypothetical protein ACFSM5_14590 [Lacibacterium aquatile]|uniref:Uncharacterized protein n=1 Tax=Lacibacterium aquatile TaxID=1168082 RepID=A0ABW5DXF6_9PROT